MSTKVTIILEDDYPEVDEQSTATVSMTSSDPDIRFMEQVFRASLHAFGFHPDTIDRLFASTADDTDVVGEGCPFGGTCCDDDEPVALGTQPMGIEEHVHADKVVETLHGDDIAART